MKDTKAAKPRHRPFAAAALFLALLAAAAAGAQGTDPRCQPTPADSLGPFYEPGAPLRSKVGEGYLLSGVVRSAEDCRLLAGATIELWMAGPDGRYSDRYRARVVSAENGRYSFESPVPVGYGGRPPHIHIRVTAAGYRTLVTQHYPEPGDGAASMDLVLRPAG
jgi:protocatechuate 3,4-dioxygenase beta subunit